MADLTQRQQQIRDLLNQKKTPPEIAERLGISDSAVYQAIRRAREREGAVATKPSKPAPTSKPAASAAPPTPSPAAPPTELRDMTPLQAIRARMKIILDQRKVAERAVTEAERELKAAKTEAERVAEKTGAEFTNLQAAELVLTGEAVARRKSNNGDKPAGAKKPLSPVPPTPGPAVSPPADAPSPPRPTPVPDPPAA